MKKMLSLTALAIAITGCASHGPVSVDANVAEQRQRAAQQAVEQPNQLALKRKIAVGRITNETNHGRSLLRADAEDELSRKVTDMFMQGLVNSNNFLIFERPDLAVLEQEAALMGTQLNLVGVDALVVGSLTQFGRANTGQQGFLTSSRTQEATATIDLRLVDVRTGQAFASVTGSGSSSTVATSTMGFGSVAGYDGSLNDRAIAAAVNSAVEKLTLQMLTQPWTADVLAFENGLVYMSGGVSQGIRPNMTFDLNTRGRQVVSPTTGATITLPGEKVATLLIQGSFGNSELEEGSFGTLISGSIAGYELTNLQVVEQR